MVRFLASAAALALASPSASQAPSTGVAVHAFECGRLVQPDLGRFNDIYRFRGQRREFAAGCFLIRHPKGNLLLWDAGLNAAMAAGSPTMMLGLPIPERLRALGMTPGDVTHVGISHYHADHSGGAADFPRAELLIGRGDWEALKAMKPEERPAQNLAPWLTGGGKVTPVAADRDVFGDGLVTMLAMPGHTAGHTALLVKLSDGWLLLSGDQYHFRENRAVRGVPVFNANRADTLASHDRFEAIAANLKARVVIQHDPRDLASLPAFPAALR
mgnify:CR=1 FL=1